MTKTVKKIQAYTGKELNSQNKLQALDSLLTIHKVTNELFASCVIFHVSSADFFLKKFSKTLNQIIKRTNILSVLIRLETLQRLSADNKSHRNTIKIFHYYMYMYIPSSKDMSQSNDNARQQETN